MAMWCRRFKELARNGEFGSQLPSILAEVLAIFSAAWAFYSLTFVFLGWSFASLMVFSVVPIGFGFIGSYFLVIRHRILGVGVGGAPVEIVEQTTGPSDPAPVQDKSGEKARRHGLALERVIWATLGLATVLLLSYRFAALPFWPFWMAGLAYLAVVVLFYGNSCSLGDMNDPLTRTGEIKTTTKRDWIALILVTVLGVVSVLGLKRPHVDDAYYFNMVLGALNHPDLPVLSFDAVHGDLNAPFPLIPNRTETYLLLIAAIIGWTGWDPLTVYYLVVPSFFGGFVAVAFWLAMKQLTPRWAWLGLLLVFLLLLSWSGNHRTFGNWSYVRMFQGKGVLISVVVPMLFHFGLRYADMPTPRNWLLLMFSVTGGCMYSSTGLLVIPIGLGLILLATCENLKTLRNASIGLLTLVPVFIVLVLLRFEIEQAVSSGYAIKAYRFSPFVLLGVGWRHTVTFICFLALPLVVIWRRSGLVRVRFVVMYVLATFAICFNEFSDDLFAWVVSNLAWRYLWAIPMPLFLAYFFSATIPLCLRVRDQAWRRHYIPISLISILLLGVFLGSADWTTNQRNGTVFEWATPKISRRALLVARVTDELTPRGGIILAPADIAWLTHYFGKTSKRLVGAREWFLPPLRRYWGGMETNSRRRLFRYINTRRPKGRETEWALTEINERCISTVVVRRHRGGSESIIGRLQESNFKLINSRGYAILSRNRLDASGSDRCVSTATATDAARPKPGARRRPANDPARSPDFFAFSRSATVRGPRDHRAARSRTSWENLLVRAMTPSCQGMESPANPGRFRASFGRGRRGVWV
jgi:hypothetical protein